ncbi:LysR family transcriptional regulator [Roseivivax sp. GX 12232]|uniref:LysR family transcriptional regulator n=1 Tax=Roseivivax sp. GX 12232 TaxID=2900547 RepID=UPI001E4C92C0|nr:LysR family transcriptional regulator [Roseivivax sp. GX 12232]
MSFRTVARLGGISAAAAQLGMAKSGVSRHVSQLEDHLGVRLLERGARSVRLTPVGRRLDDRIRSILAEIELLGDIVQEERAGVTGQVTIAATPEFGALVAAYLFPELRRRHPDLSLVMRADYAFEDMQDPGTDLAIRVGSVHDDRLIAKPMGGFRRWLVATPELAEAASLEAPADLAQQPCLTFRGDRPGATWRFVAEDQEAAVDVSGPIAVRNFGVLLELARAGQGFAFLPAFMLRDALACGALVRCLPEWTSPEAPVFLTFRPGTRNIARVAAVLEVAEEILPDLSRE